MFSSSYDGFFFFLQYPLTVIVSRQNGVVSTPPLLGNIILLLPLFVNRDLEADHSEKLEEDRALALLKGLREGGEDDDAPATTAGEQAATDTVTALKRYVASLEGHLEREERALVGRWLNLTPELYTTYRTYLVGKYRLVY